MYTAMIAAALARAVAALEVANLWLCHPLVTFLQVQGAAIALLLAAGWAWSGVMRAAELRQLQDARRRRLSQEAMAAHTTAVDVGGRTAAVKQQRHAADASPPGVTVVLPVKGCRKHSLLSWQSQVAMTYDGPLEFIFVVDDAADPAHEALRSVGARAKGVNMRVLISSPATTCSQKIHNLLAGIGVASPQSQYVLCLDDDVILHPGSLQMLVSALLADDSYFMATGYPFDIPPPDANLLTYCVLVYHLPLLIAFSIRQQTDFIWGGCMLMPLAALRDDRHGIMQAWREGGYSDDLIVASRCGERRLKIVCPSSAVFAQLLDANFSGPRYWNYLRRQLYVLDTYVSDHNRRVNHTMMALHPYLSLALVAPILTGATRLLIWVLEIAVLPTQQVYDGPGTSWQWLATFGLRRCPLSLASLAALLLSLLAAHFALRWMTGVVLALIRELSPSAAEKLTVSHFAWPKVWLALVINNAVLPLCMAHTYLCPHVDWSGVRYFKRRGRVERVQHLRQTFDIRLHQAELAERL